MSIQSYKRSFFFFLSLIFVPFLSYGTDSCAFTSASSATFTAQIYNEFTVSVDPTLYSTIIYNSDDESIDPNDPTQNGLPPGLSWINNNDGTATLFGIPERSSELEKEYSLVFIAAPAESSNGAETSIVDVFECYMLCSEDPRACEIKGCDFCTQQFTLTIQSSPCDFISANSTRFVDPLNRNLLPTTLYPPPNRKHVFRVEVSSDYKGNIAVFGDLPETVTVVKPSQQPDSYLELKYSPPFPPVKEDGCYPLRFSFSGGGCTSQQDFFLAMGSAQCPPPPRDVIGELKPSPIVVALGGKNKNKSNDYDDIIRWKAPKKSGSILGYNIFADRKMKKLLFSTPSQGKKRFQTVMRNMNPCRSKKFFVASVDAFGRKSKPVKIEINKSKSDCKKHKGKKKDESSSSTSSCS